MASGAWSLGSTALGTDGEDMRNRMPTTGQLGSDREWAGFQRPLQECPQRPDFLPPEPFKGSTTYHSTWAGNTWGSEGYLCKPH